MSKPMLYLLPEERVGYDAIAQDIRTTVMCDCREEDPTYLETPEQSAVRLRILGDHATPGLRDLAQRIDSTTPPDLLAGALDFSALSSDDLSLLFSALGARGLSALIAVGLERCASADDLYALCHLTGVRHGLLLSNAEFFHATA